METDEIPDFGEHPLALGDLNLCDLAKSFEIDPKRTSKNLKITEILQILIIEYMESKELQELDFTGKGKTQSLMALKNALVDYIREKCGCIL